MMIIFGFGSTVGFENKVNKKSLREQIFNSGANICFQREFLNDRKRNTVKKK